MNNVRRYTSYFITIADTVAIIAAGFLAFYVRFTVFQTPDDRYDLGQYFLFGIITVFSYYAMNIFYREGVENILKRGYFSNFINSFRTCFAGFALTVIILNFTRLADFISRPFEIAYFVLLILLTFIFRQGVKAYLNNYYQKNNALDKIIVISSSDRIHNVLKQADDRYDWRNSIIGIILIDKAEEETIEGIRVLGTTDGMMETLSEYNYDSILITDNSNPARVQEWINQFQQEGKIVHVYVTEFDYVDAVRNFDSIGDMAVVTYHMISPMTRRQSLLKRFFDILFSVLLMPVFAVVYILVRLLTGIESPGSVLVKRVRVGRNSSRFYQYRFRIFRADARERMEKGKSPYTVMGSILSKTHLDGFAMILNVLSGEMSFVGPKAPNLPKYLDMSSRQKNILSAKPGMVGYWSCSNSMDKIIEDEQNYVEHWNLLKDITILFVMFFRYISGVSLRIDGEKHVDEELEFCDEILYDRRGVLKEPLKIRITLLDIIKRLFDIVASLAGLIVMAIPMLIISIIIILNDGGLPVYSQKRVGRNGIIFDMYKFRSMRVNAGEVEKLLDSEQLENFRREYKIDNDPRVTKVGEFLRKSSLDELPQLINILKGEMSLVGPRAIIEEELFANYSEEEVRKFLSVIPGLTGYWQAYARNDAEYINRERQEMELYYIRNRSLLLDIRILFRTVYAVLARKGVR